MSTEATKMTKQEQEMVHLTINNGSVNSYV